MECIKSGGKGGYLALIMALTVVYKDRTSQVPLMLPSYLFKELPQASRPSFLGLFLHNCLQEAALL